MHCTSQQSALRSNREHGVSGFLKYVPGCFPAAYGGPDVVYSTGDCPVCFDSSALLLVVAKDTGRLLVHCPSCGAVWKRPEDAAASKYYLGVKDLAPQGMRSATSREIEDAGLASLVVGPWHGDVGEIEVT